MSRVAMNRYSGKDETLSRPEQVGLEVEALLLGLRIPLKPRRAKGGVLVGASMNAGLGQTCGFTRAPG